MESLEIQPLLVKKGLTVRQNFLLVIFPSFVVSLKKSLFAFLVKELHLFLVLLFEIRFYIKFDGQFKFFFFALDLFIIALLRFLVIKGAWFPLFVLVRRDDSVYSLKFSESYL